jgi:hypothetical protein
MVKAGPASFMRRETATMRPCNVPRRIAAWNCAACFTTSGETRSKSRRMSFKFSFMGIFPG